MFSEVDKCIYVLFRLGGLPRIALLTTGFPGLFISICTKILLMLLLLYCAVIIHIIY